MKWKTGRIKKILVRIAASIVVIAACTGTYLGYTYIIRMKYEPPTALKDTSTEPAVYQLNELKDVLAQFEDFYTVAERNNLENTMDYGTYVIPGLKATKTINLDTHKIDMCTSMTPQSIAVTPEYLLVSGYCHTKEHSSVLFVIDKDSHKYVKTVVLPGHSHVGGLAFDSENEVIWVSGRKRGVSYANSYTLEAIEEYSVDESQNPLAFRQMVPLIQLKQNSFMTYKEGHLYAGYFSQSGEGVLYKYALDDEGRLESSKPVESVDETAIENDDTEEVQEKAKEEQEEIQESEEIKELEEIDEFEVTNSTSIKDFSEESTSAMQEEEKEAGKKEEKIEEEEAEVEDKFDPVGFANMPSLVQGISFYGNEYLLVAESYGMMKSKLRVFRNDESNEEGYSFTDENAIVSYTLPDKLECACVADGKVYLVFEAAAYAYRVRPMYNIDRVLTLNINHDIAISSRLIQ